jgi:ABC-type transport system substrate-binding protein
MKKNRAIALLIILSMVVVLLAGCSSNSAKTNNTTKSSDNATSAGSNKKNTLRVGINADPGTLAPFVASGSGFSYIAWTLYEPLADLDSVGGKLQGYIMKEYKEVAKLTYNITIYDKVFDTAGNQITADDVIFSINTLKANNASANMKYIDSIKKLDDYSIEMKLNCDFIGGLGRVLASCRIVSKKSYEASADQMAKTPVGTTGYKMTNYVPGATITFEKTNKFWQNDASKRAAFQGQGPDVIEYQIIKEAAQMAIALETGKIDLALQMDSAQAKRFMEGGSNANKGFKVFTTESNIVNQMYLNCDTDTAFYNNKALRQAVLTSIDKAGLVKGAVSGFGNPLHDFGSNLFPDYSKKWDSQDYTDYNVEKAKKLLEQAGYKPGQLTLKIMTDNTALRNKVAQMIQGYLQVIGINSQILQYDQALFNKYKIDTANAHEWDICLDNTGASDYLAAVYRSKFDSRSFDNGTTNGVKDEKLQQLILKANSPDSHTAEDMDNLHNYMTDQAYAMGLFSNTTFMVARKGVEKLVFDSKCYVAPCATVFSSEY